LKKTFCPNCGEECKEKTFVLYIDKDTKEVLHPTVGKCDRKDKCKYHKRPRQYFEEQGITFDKKVPYKPRKEPIPTPKPQPSYIDMEVFKGSLKRYSNNRLVQFLYRVFGVEVTDRAIERYHVGTCKQWDGATVFWEVDLQGKVRAGKVMQYDENGHRRKDVTLQVQWVHKIKSLKLDGFNLSQCFFGEHLLVDTTKTVAIVESEKTAVIASIDDPDMIWLACGGCEGLPSDITAEKYKPLKGRNVILYPDAKKLDEWSEKAKKLESICTVSVFPVIEELATKEEKTAGYDLADYIVEITLQEKAEQERSEQVARVQEQVPAPTIDVQDSAIDVQEYQLAYVGNDGTLYTPTPPDRRTTHTVRESVDAYNQRKGTISFIPIQNMDTSGMKQVSINLKTLTI
jgi:hypothetical protein